MVTSVNRSFLKYQNLCNGVLLHCQASCDGLDVGAVCNRTSFDNLVLRLKMTGFAQLQAAPTFIHQNFADTVLGETGNK